jgi:NADPH:quinone reductase-like Zn-dependent oxidoreductase
MRLIQYQGSFDMKALAAFDYGPPENLRIIDLPVPDAGAGQIQVRIKATTINPTDLRVITGEYRDMLPVEFPYVPGNDFAGTVTAVGAGVSNYHVGDEVFGQALPRQLRAVTSPTRPSVSTGALAEYAVFEADTLLLAHRPASVTSEHAAALAISGMTARAIMKIAAMKRGQTALVIGATGGTGSSLIPLLSMSGVHTTATARSEEGRELVLRLGANAVIPLDPASYPSNVDVVFNLALFSERIADAAKSLKSGGKMVTIMFPAATQQDLRRDDIELHFMLDMDGEYGGMPDVAEAAANGNLTAEVACVFPFEKAVEAVLAYATEKPLGKVVVSFSDDRAA